MHGLPAASLPLSAACAVFDLPDVASLIAQRCDARAIASLSCACRFLRARSPPLWGALLSARWPSYRLDVQTALAAPDRGVGLRAMFASLAAPPGVRRWDADPASEIKRSRFKAADYTLHLSADAGGRGIFDSGLVPLEAAFHDSGWPIPGTEATLTNTLGASEQQLPSGEHAGGGGGSGARDAAPATLRDLLDSCAAVLTIHRSDGAHVSVQLPPSGGGRRPLSRKRESEDEFYAMHGGDEAARTEEEEGGCTGVQLVAYRGCGPRGKNIQTAVHVRIDLLKDPGFYSGTCDVLVDLFFATPLPAHQAGLAAADGGLSGDLPALLSPQQLRVGTARVSVGWRMPGGDVLQTTPYCPSGLVRTEQIVLFAQSLFREASLGTPPPVQSAAPELGPATAAASGDGSSGDGSGGSAVGAGNRSIAGEAAPPPGEWAAAHYFLHLNVSLAGVPVFAGRLPLATTTSPSLPLRWAENLLPDAPPAQLLQCERHIIPGFPKPLVFWGWELREHLVAEFSALRSDGRVAAVVVPTHSYSLSTKLHFAGRKSTDGYHSDDGFPSDDEGDVEAGGVLGITIDGRTYADEILPYVLVDLSPSRGFGWEGNAALRFRLLLSSPVAPASAEDAEAESGGGEGGATDAAAGAGEGGVPPKREVVRKRTQTISQALMCADWCPGGHWGHASENALGPLRFESEQELLLLLKAFFINGAEV